MKNLKFGADCDSGQPFKAPPLPSRLSTVKGKLTPNIFDLTLLTIKKTYILIFFNYLIFLPCVPIFKPKSFFLPKIASNMN
jgi:hypothetical protein